MSGRTQQARGKVLISLKRATLTVGLLYVGVALIFGVHSYLRSQETRSNEAASIEAREQLSTLEKEVEQASRLQEPVASSNLNSVAKFQAGVERLVLKHNCAISEFRAAPDIQPFLTRFSKTEQTEGWNQVEAQLSISGKVGDVMSVLGELTEPGVPFEFNTLELSRESVDRYGNATVQAKTSLRVLIKAEGAKA